MNNSIEKKIQAEADVAPRITPKDVANNVTEIEIVKHVTPSGKVLRWGVITTKNGYAVTGKPSTSVSPQNDNQSIGEEIAIDNAKSEMWALMGYELQSKLMSK